MEDIGHQLSNVSKRRYQLRPLISSVQHKAATQEIVQQIAAELQSRCEPIER